MDEAEVGDEELYIVDSCAAFVAAGLCAPDGEGRVWVLRIAADPPDAKLGLE